MQKALKKFNKTILENDFIGFQKSFESFLEHHLVVGCKVRAVAGEIAGRVGTVEDISEDDSTVQVQWDNGDQATLRATDLEKVE